MTQTRNEIIAALTAPGEKFEIAPLQIGNVTVRSYRNMMQSLRDVLLSAAPFADRDFIIYEDIRWTFGWHQELVARFARYLQDEVGVGHGERVAIAMRNLPEWSVAFWAAQVIGAVAVPLNAWWTGPEMAFSLDDSGAVALVADADRLDRLATFLPRLGLRSVILAGTAHPSADASPPAIFDATFDEACVEARRAPDDEQFPDVAIGPDDLSTIVYTSGTTGTPKGAMHVHRNHCTAVMNNTMFVEVGRILAAEANPAAVTVDPPPQTAALLTFPLFHVAGIVNLYLPMATGSKLVLLHRWDTVKAVDVMLREGVTSTVVVPTLLRQLLESDELRDDPRMRLGSIAAGGATVPGELVRRVATRFDNRVAPGNGYGLTETTAGVFAFSGAEYVAHPDSIGRPFPVDDIRLVDEHGDDVEQGAVGEFWVRGPNVVLGYWNNPQATADSFTDGWFHTGDLGKCDADGLYYIVDRLKDVVIRGGENIYSAEVEGVLAAHGNVDEVAVFGIPHEQLGEELVAVVRLSDDGAAAEEELRSFVGERLAYFKVPARIVMWGHELPRTASGKVLKRDLREQAFGK